MIASVVVKLIRAKETGRQEVLYWPIIPGAYHWNTAAPMVPHNHGGYPTFSLTVYIWLCVNSLWLLINPQPHLIWLGDGNHGYLHRFQVKMMYFSPQLHMASLNAVTQSVGPVQINTKVYQTADGKKSPPTVNMQQWLNHRCMWPELYIFLRMNATAMHYLSHGSFCQKKKPMTYVTISQSWITMIHWTHRTMIMWSSLFSRSFK